MEPLSIQQLKLGLTESMRKVFPNEITLKEIPDPSPHAPEDTTIKYLVNNTKEKTPIAFVKCSLPGNPDIAATDAERSTAAKRILGPELGNVILDVIHEGQVQGLSYFVSPYRHSFNHSRILNHFQRLLISPRITQWLIGMTKKTVSEASAEETLLAFQTPLEHLARLSLLGPHIRAAAKEGLNRILKKKWIPRHILMHGDISRGNILINSNVNTKWDKPWNNRFIVIDWPWSLLKGYPISDLLHFSISFGLNRKQLYREIMAHCDIIKCDPMDARHYILAKLGHLGMHWKYFPIEDYVKVSNEFFNLIDQTVSSYR